MKTSGDQSKTGAASARIQILTLREIIRNANQTNLLEHQGSRLIVQSTAEGGELPQEEYGPHEETGTSNGNLIVVEPDSSRQGRTRTSI